jgi:superfamily I DNA/RNA helicase
VLSTIHSAKRQEWRSVFILDVIDGRIHPISESAPVDNVARSAGCSRRK